MAKLRNISYIVKEIAINSSTTNYELNGIVGNNLEFYGLDKITGNYKELPKAWYQLIKNNGNYVFKVVDPSIFNYSKIQVALWYDNKSLTYVTEFNPDIKVLVDRYNILVNTVSQLWEYTKRQMIVGDSMEMHLILPKLKTDEVWICKGDHYEAISIVDLNAELRKLIDQYANMYKVELEQKTNEQKGILNTYTNSQKEAIELYKNEKLNELLNKLTSLKSELDTYTSSKKEEMDRYRTSLNGVLYNENKNRINDYTDVKFREIDSKTNDSKNAIELKKIATLNSMEEPIARIVEIKVDGMFTSKSPVYLSQLKTELDSYVVMKQTELNTSIENKVDGYIATKDGLITQKVTDIATTNINQAVATAKQNVLNEIQSQADTKVQEAISSFNTQANTITAEKLKAIGDRDAVGLDFNWNGTQLGIKKENESSYTYKELKGEQGIQGLRGERGHNSVIVSETEPNKAEYDVWIKPTENGIDIGTLLQQGSQGSSDNNKLIKGTGSPKGVVQAEIHTLYLDKAKTNGAYLWLKTGNNNTDWKVIKGDTGTIEFTSKVLDGKIRIRRIDNLVILNFGGLQWDLFRLKPKAEVNGSSARKYTYNGNFALQLKLTNKDNLTQFVIPYGLRSVYPIYTPLFHDSGILLGSIFVAPNSDSNMIRFNIMGTEYADNGYVDLRCSNIIYYTDDDYPENLQNLIRGLIQ
jgi:hypothetical protein|nr:MAG TPA: hypothetical protein [Bacteriophage sp.]